MKTKLLITVVVLFMAGLSERKALAQLPEHWVDHEKKTVYYSPDLDLKQQLIHVGIDENRWDILMVSLKYNISTGQSQTNLLMNEYPNYLAAKVLSQKNEDFVVNIPLLGVQNKVQTLNGIEGPYLRAEYYVSKSLSASVKKSMEAGTLVEIQGLLKVLVPETRILERIELPKTVCADLFKTSHTVIDVVSNTARIFSKIDRNGSRYESTRDALKKALIENCVDYPGTEKIESFADLLRAKVDLRSANSNIYGETTVVSTVEKTTPVHYIVTKEPSKESGGENEVSK